VRLLIFLKINPLARNLLLIYIADFKIIKGLPGLLAIGIENLVDFFKRNKYNLDVLINALTHQLINSENLLE